MWNYIFKKIFDFDFEIAIQAIENPEEGKDKKNVKVQVLKVLALQWPLYWAGVSVLNVCSENGQMQANGFCSFIIII